MSVYFCESLPSVFADDQVEETVVYESAPDHQRADAKWTFGQVVLFSAQVMPVVSNSIWTVEIELLFVTPDDFRPIEPVLD